MSTSVHSGNTTRLPCDQSALHTSKHLLTDSELALMRVSEARRKMHQMSIHNRRAWGTAVEFANSKIKAAEAETKYFRYLAETNQAEDADVMEEVRDASLLVEKANATMLEKRLYQRQVNKITRGEAVSTSLA
ncbi:hypothetical protein SMACR_02756 [Sordaria macrospora]|uniref:WGS project CABT00000000 data, contig 2.11 n=2 Tax=Sordaria macrospora TaxID=5147 RepID=F7VXD6_SORMK|nr:uncharacterized protein SMAC_02756 [Sordaria macrospora k-hell]KAA8627966.1 hypothetical protein SMACR_02756 [Sordaria macrospora]WPJ60411.1 hypothetical protein SMAC4_02756 [Sordaria macrospora]CCC10178.1 unnamed protein product [Sordaria macrospora k-hell]